MTYMPCHAKPNPMQSVEVLGAPIPRQDRGNGEVQCVGFALYAGTLAIRRSHLQAGLLGRHSADGRYDIFPSRCARREVPHVVCPT